jgi:hypothetical protein
MNRLPTYILAGGALLLGPLASTAAADDAETSAEGGLVERPAVMIETSIGGFETTELAGVRFAPGPISTEIKPSVRSAAANKDNTPGFLYFRESAEVEIDSPDLTLNLGTARSATFTPRSGFAPAGANEGIDSFLMPGEAWLLSTFTPRYANAHISLTYGRKDEESARKALGIELSSSLRVRQMDMPGLAASPSLAEALSRQQYNLGLNVGYLGFNLGASLRSEMGEFSDGFKGYDVGLSYRGSSWSTSFSVGEYSRRYSHVFSDTEDLENTYYAFELGASYSFSRAFSLTGGFRHFEYGRSNLLDTEAAQRSQIFYLGTRLSF